MARKLMWFTTADHGEWISCPQINTGMNSVRWLATAQYLNGGAGQRQSNTSHKEYTFAWSPQRAEDIARILSYFDGTYGDGPYYFVDPITETTNILPPYWSAPWLTADTAPSLAIGVVPDIIPTPSTNGYPTRSAAYELAGTETSRVLYLPVPDGYTLHFGAHGVSSGTASVVVNGVDAPMLSTATSQRTNVTVAGPALVPITIGGAGTLTLTGTIAQLRVNGDVVPSGGYIHGQGNSGVRLQGDPTITGYSAALENASEGVSVELVETGAWDD